MLMLVNKETKEKVQVINTDFDDKKIILRLYRPSDEEFFEKQYNSLEDMSEEWEIYKPKIWYPVYDLACKGREINEES